ncbi:unnamed protein product [Lactuca virosa]|uniref:Stomatal closure-related actin-binding protein coiled-coil domain-containing protein n=1 Tax=Lactuca virosa TaxID=75947 RepID=A0AAU9NU38_9ASTR|nr:unnamed protein product [Lactuca virosa]CAH1441459.1 unnamed protein product [Lactuca virosa]
MESTFELTPDIHSYNALLTAFGKLHKRDEAVRVFEHLVSLGVKPNEKTYALLTDAHLIKRDVDAAVSTVNDMVMDMEHELRALRIQLAEKSKRSIELQKEESCDGVLAFEYYYLHSSWSYLNLFLNQPIGEINYLASTDYDDIVKIWDAGIGEAVYHHMEHERWTWSVDFSQVDPMKLASGSGDCTVKLCSINEIDHRKKGYKIGFNFTVCDS